MTDYCSVTDVTWYIGAGGLTDAQITSQITMQSAIIDKRLGSQSTSDEVVKNLCALMTAREIARKRPDEIQLLGTSQNWESTMRDWDQRIRELSKMYKTPKVKPSAYQVIDEDDRFDEKAEDVELN